MGIGGATGSPGPPTKRAGHGLGQRTFGGCAAQGRQVACPAEGPQDHCFDFPFQSQDLLRPPQVWQAEALRSSLAGLQQEPRPPGPMPNGFNACGGVAPVEVRRERFAELLLVILGEVEEGLVTGMESRSSGPAGLPLGMRLASLALSLLATGKAAAAWCPYTTRLIKDAGPHREVQKALAKRKAEGFKLLETLSAVRSVRPMVSSMQESFHND